MDIVQGFKNFQISKSTQTLRQSKIGLEQFVSIVVLQPLQANFVEASRWEPEMTLPGENE